MSANWSVTVDDDGVSRICRLFPSPCFTARWTTQSDDLADADGPFWHDAGSGENEDELYLYHIVWSDPPPGQAEIESLMQKAAEAIDAWIMQRV